MVIVWLSGEYVALRARFTTPSGKLMICIYHPAAQDACFSRMRIVERGRIGQNEADNGCAIRV